MRSLKTLYDHLSDDGVLLFEGETYLKPMPPLDVWRGSVCFAEWSNDHAKPISNHGR